MGQEHGKGLGDLPSTGGGVGGKVEVSKAVVDWGLDAFPSIPLNKPLVDRLTIRNNNNYNVKFHFEPCFPREFQLNFSPADGTIKANKEKEIKAKLVIRSKVNQNFKVNLQIEGAGCIFLTARIRCETGVFGVDPTTLDQVQDGEFKVPAVLVALKKAFFENDGLDQEGVFRLAGEQLEVKQFKQQMNKGDFSMPTDVNAIATLIKIWYRELPTPVLNTLPSKQISDCSTVSDSVQLFQALQEPYLGLTNWLLDLLLTVTANRTVNKMTAQNLAIVVAPNLYEAMTPDPMEALVMSQKAAQFVHNLLTWRQQEVGTKPPPEIPDTKKGKSKAKDGDDDDDGNEGGGNNPSGDTEADAEADGGSGGGAADSEPPEPNPTPSSGRARSHSHHHRNPSPETDSNADGETPHHRTHHSTRRHHH
ncbi:GTPaseactivating protein gacA [Pelomyxa schiedti]|nr:GTPaseactivating protein gacA [Pelomyxa schiedti]